MEEYDWGWGDTTESTELIDWGWGDVDYSNGTSGLKLSTNAINQLAGIKNDALSTGNKKVGNIIDNILSKGIDYVVRLGNAGLWKNKNIPSTVADFNTSVVDDNGNILTQDSTTANTTTRSTTTDILGIPITYIIVALVGTVLYFLFKSENKKSK